MRSFNPFQSNYCFETLTIAKKHPGFKAGFNPFQGSYCFETALASLSRTADWHPGTGRAA